MKAKDFSARFLLLGDIEIDAYIGNKSQKRQKNTNSTERQYKHVYWFEHIVNRHTLYNNLLNQLPKIL